MSNDTMPCGCEGHMDNLGLCRFPALEAELAAEREARQRAEAELARVQGLPELEWAQAAAVIMQGLALHARTDHPAAKRMADALDRAKTYVDRLKQRAERSEADNAAWVMAARAAVVLLRDDANPTECQCGAEEGTNVHDHDSTCPLKFFAPLLTNDHPGAALLERLRALEAVRAACEPYREAAEGQEDVATKRERALMDACAKADALGGGR